MKLRTPIASLLLLAGLSGAHAGTVGYQTTVALQPTNLASFVDLQQFDPSLGTLQSVTVTLQGEIASLIKLESKNSTPATLTATVTGTVTLALPAVGTLTATPVLSQSFNAASYDGIVDYAGTSGITYPLLNASASAIQSYTQPQLLAPFVGTGTLHASFDANAVAAFTGPSNKRTSVRTDAGGFASVTYTYLELRVPAVPEPETWTLMATGLGLVGWLASRRRAA